jgi:hypothetical protein
VGYELRLEDRYDVAVAASFHSGPGAARPVRVVNLSARGCRFVARDSRHGVGTAVTLKFGRVEALNGRVKWRIGGTHGIRFEQPLQPAELDHIRLFLSEQPALAAEREPATL